ncbi:MAG: D-alanyl-D-alanine carboxypeptidase, partial [Acidimicrobiales bacterium]
GDLFLVGGRDPLLRTPDFVNGLPNATPLYTSFTQLAAEVHAAGVTEITGGVVGDEGRYDSLRNVASWKPIYQAEGDVGPLSALDVDDGLIPANKAVTPAAPPPVQSAELMASLLGAEGVKVDGAAGAAPAPAGSVAIASVVSPPLSSELAEILRESDDTAAELVTKELGYHAGTGGSTAAGTAMVRSVLAAHGLPVGQLVDSDGSGLSTDDRATCELIDRTLDLGGPAGALARDLPVAAVSGTLHARLVGTPAAGRVTAKSGNLDGVDALSGYVQPATGAGAPTGPMAAALTFSFVVNNIATASAGDSAEDNLALSLAGYPHLLPLALLSPAPPR